MSRHTIRIALFAVICAAALSVLSGCGDDSSDPRKYAADQPVNNSKSVFVDMDRELIQREQEIVESVGGFVDAVHAKDWKKVCERYFSLKAQAQYGGPKTCEPRIRKVERDFEGLTMKVLGFQHVEAGSRIAVTVQSRATPVPHKEFFDIAPGKNEGEWTIQPIPKQNPNLGGAQLGG